MKKSLQSIGDFYINNGIKRSKLRKTLEKDGNYKKLFKERKNKIKKEIRLTSKDKKLYVLSTDLDLKILGKCKQLEKLKLKDEEKKMVKLIKMQLKDDWRSPLIDQLNKILKEYRQ